MEQQEMSQQNLSPTAGNADVIDLREVFKKIFSKKLFYVKLWTVTFVLACAYILPQPRSYTADIMLAPEAGGTSMGGTLAGIASSFGIDIGGNTGGDALYPELYPEVMSSNKFVVDMLYVKVQNVEGEESTYLDFLRTYNRQNPYAVPFKWVKRQVMRLVEGDGGQGGGSDRINPRRLSRREFELVENIRECIKCDVDIKTSVITITTHAQDPLVATTLADSACQSLQNYITNYRTSKARIDAEYYQQLRDSAYLEYKKSVSAYSDFCDRHKEVSLQSYISIRDDLENTMQTNLNTYNAVLAQYNVAKAKIQENTPAFTVLKAATVPVKPTSPKRMIFVALMLVLATIGGTGYILKDELLA